MKTKLLALICLLLSLKGFTQSSYTANISITDFGAKPDGKTLCTNAFKQAIDKAFKQGGGTVIAPPGTWLTGTVSLKNNVTLRVEAGATILGSCNIADYEVGQWFFVDRQPYHLISIKDCKNAALEGKGIIDGHGRCFWNLKDTLPDGEPVTPRWIMAKDKKISPLVEVDNAEDISIKDVTIKTGGGWNLDLLNCSRVQVQGVKILNSLYSPNSDGIDITGSEDVTVSDCYIKTCDDGICLKTTPDSRVCQRIVVTNCVIQTHCVGLKLGCNESFKDIRDVTFSNCVIDKSSRAIGLYTREGGTFENIAFNNIVCNTNAPLVLNRPIQILAEQAKPESKTGTIRNVSISNFQGQTEGRILVTSAKGCTIENITFRDVSLAYSYIEDPGLYVSGAKSNQFPKAESHPEARGALASFVADNVKNLVVANYRLTWPDASKPAPLDWQLKERIENGGMRVFKPDYSKSHQADLAVFFLKNVQGGYINAPMANPSASGAKWAIESGSDIRIIK